MTPRLTGVLRKGAAVAFCVWGVVGIGWYAGNATGLAPALSSIVLRTVDLLVLALVALSAAGVGARVLSWLGIRIDDPWARAAFALGVGFVWVYSAITVLSLFQMLSFASASLVVLLPLLVFMREHHEIVGALRAAPRSLPSDTSGRFVFAFLLLYAILALTPPMFIDPLSYHLALPKQYIAAGGFTRDFSNHFHSFPPAMSMQYTLLMLLGSDWLPKLLHALYFGMMLAVFRWFLSRHASPWVGRTAMLLFVAQWSVLHAVQRANVEFYWGFYGLASVMVWLDALLREDSPFRDRWGVVSGLFLGAAIAGKLQALNVATGLVALAAYAIWTRAIRPRSMVPLVFFAALAYLPVVLRNGFFVAEPLFLFAPELAPGWLRPDAAEVARFAAMAEWKDLFMTRPGPVTALFLPIFMFVHGAYPTTSFDGFLDPFFVPALLILPFLIRGRPLLRALVVYGVGFYVAWLLTAPLTRYLFPALPLSAFVTATALGAIIDWAEAAGRGFWGSTIKGLIFAFATVCLVSIPLDHGKLLGHAVPGFLGFETRDYFERLSGAHAHRKVSETIDSLEAQSDVPIRPEDAKVFYIFESRVYFLDRPYYNDPFYVNLVLLRESAASGLPPLEYLRGGQFRYVVTDFGRIPWLRNERNWNPWLNPYPEALRRLETMLTFWDEEVEPLLIRRGRFGPIELFEVPGLDSRSPPG